MLFRLSAALLVTLLPLSAQGELSGRRAPGFALPDLNLNYHDLADLQGRVVLIEIMQTSCPHCKTLTATLEKAKEKYGNKIAVLHIVNPPDNQDTVKTYMKENGVTSPMLFDCGQMAASYLMISPQRPSISVPHLFVIDQSGFIRNDFGHSEATRGIFEGSGLDAEIDKALAPKPAAKKK